MARSPRGRVPSGRLLAAVRRALCGEALPPTRAARILAELTGDAIAAFWGVSGSAYFRAGAVCHRVPEDEARWQETFARPVSMLEGGLGQVVILGQPRLLGPLQWPRPGVPPVRVLLVPMAAGRSSAGVIAVLRAQAEPPFSDAEENAVMAIASRVGLDLLVDERERRHSLDRQEFELMRSALRLVPGQGDVRTRIQPLLVHARQSLGARSLALLVQGTGRLDLVAASGFQDVRAVRSWPPGEATFLAAAVFDHRPCFAPDPATLPWSPELGSLRDLVGMDGPLLALPVGGPGATAGVLLSSWHSGTVPAPSIRALAAQVADLAGILLAHDRLERDALEARASRRIATEVTRQREAIVRQIAHDLRNSIHVLGLASEELAESATGPPGVRIALGTLERQCAFIGAYLRDKLRALEEDPFDPAIPGSLGAAFSRLVETAPDRLAGAGRQLRVGLVDPVFVKVPQRQLDQLLEALVAEAAAMAAPGGTLELWATAADGWVTVTVEDDGPGLSTDAQTLLLARNGPDSPAAGLGAVAELAAAVGGHFGLRSHAGDRTALHVGLPSAEWGTAPGGQVE